jgi:hypothetical protein
MPAKQLEASVGKETGVAVTDLSCLRPQRLLRDRGPHDGSQEHPNHRSANQKEKRQCRS